MMLAEHHLQLFPLSFCRVLTGSFRFVDSQNDFVYLIELFEFTCRSRKFPAKWAEAYIQWRLDLLCDPINRIKRISLLHCVYILYVLCISAVLQFCALQFLANAQKVASPVENGVQFNEDPQERAQARVVTRLHIDLWRQQLTLRWLLLRLTLGVIEDPPTTQILSNSNKQIRSIWRRDCHLLLWRILSLIEPAGIGMQRNLAFD